MSQARRQRIVAAHHKTIDALGLDEMAEQFAIVRDDIEIELAYVT